MLSQINMVAGLAGSWSRVAASRDGPSRRGSREKARKHWRSLAGLA